MNTPSTIEISKSSLLSLKAEVLRKQQEIKNTKQQAKFQLQPTVFKFKNNKNDFSSEPSNKDVKKRQEKDEYEDEDMLEKSRRMLQYKVRLYSKLSKGPGNLTEEEIELHNRILVQFDRKPREQSNNNDDSESESHSNDEYEPTDNSDEEWVNYIDCLGRTRRCLRKDLKYLREKDQELLKTIKDERVSSNCETDTQRKSDADKLTESTEKENFTENNELLSNDMRRELLRKEWEKQEQELMNKKNIHYQDILFNEARTHGVGYYVFSKDEEERAKQQEELRKLREETTQQQKLSFEQKDLREKQLAARLKAARNRKRARMGLPPEEDEAENTSEKKQEQESDEEMKKKTEKELAEKARDDARKQMRRPWDIGKEMLKKHYEYSQEEWMEKKRLERLQEFAPPSLYRTEFKAKMSTAICTEIDKSLYFTTKRKKDEKAENSTIEFLPSPNLGQRISSSINPYELFLDDKDEDSSSVILFGPEPIVDEPIDSDSSNNSHDLVRKQHIERQDASPPPTFDYYGPSQTSLSSCRITSKNSLEESVMAGLRYLREQAERKVQTDKKRKC